MSPGRRVSLIAIGLWLPLCGTAQTELQDATRELAENYEKCQSRLTDAKAQIELLVAQVKSLKALDENARVLEKDIVEIQGRYNLIIAKFERMLELSGQIEERHVQNTASCQASVIELQKALVEVNEKYNAAIGALNRPWYLRPMFFLGALLGLAIGIPL